MTRFVVTFVGLLSVVGCQDFNEAMQSERKPAAPAGVASTDDVQAVQDATGGGSAPQANGAAAPQPQAGETNAAAPAAVGAAQPAEAAPPQGGLSQLIKVPAKIVEMSSAMQDPNIVEASTKVTGSDPLSVVASAYRTQQQKIQLLNLTNEIKIFQATNEHYPSFAEFEKMRRAQRVDFSDLLPFQMYGYDEKTGVVKVLEDKLLKIRLYKKYDIAIPPEDQKYDKE